MGRLKKVLAVLLCLTMIFQTSTPTAFAVGEVLKTNPQDTLTEQLVGEDAVSTPEASPEATPEATPEASPEATPEASPEATPEASPEATPEASPEATPEASPEASPEATPEASPEATPEASPEATPKASPEVAPKASPEVTTKSEPKELQPQVASVLSAASFALPSDGFYDYPTKTADNGMDLLSFVNDKNSHDTTSSEHIKLEIPAGNPPNNHPFEGQYTYDFQFPCKLDLNGIALDLYKPNDGNFVRFRNTDKVLVMTSKDGGKISSCEKGQPTMYIQNVGDFVLQAQVESKRQWISTAEGYACGNDAIRISRSNFTMKEGAGVYSFENIALRISDGSVVNIEAGTVDGGPDEGGTGAITVGAGCTLNITGGKIMNSHNGTIVENLGGIVNITGGDFTSTGTMFKGNVKVKGGHFNSRLPAENIAEGYIQTPDGWVTKSDGLVTIKFTNSQGECNFSDLMGKAPGQSVKIPMWEKYLDGYFGKPPVGVTNTKDPSLEFKGWKCSADGSEIRQRDNDKLEYANGEYFALYTIPEGHSEITMEAMWGTKGARRLWLDWDGTVLKEAYGANAQAPADPTRSATLEYTYRFDRWEFIKGYERDEWDATYQAVYVKEKVSHELTLRSDGNGYISSNSNGLGEHLQESTKTLAYGESLSDYDRSSNRVDGFGMYCFANQGYNVSNITWSTKANPDVEIPRPDKITEPLFITVHFEPQFFSLWFMTRNDSRHVNVQVQYGHDAQLPEFDSAFVYEGSALHTFTNGYKNVTDNNREVKPVVVSMNKILPGLTDLNEGWTTNPNHGVLDELTMADTYKKAGWQVRCATEGFETEFSSGPIQIRYQAKYEFKAPDTGYVTPYQAGGKLDTGIPETEWRSVYRLTGNSPVSTDDSLSPVEGARFYIRPSEVGTGEQSGIDHNTLKVVDEEGTNYEIKKEEAWGFGWGFNYYVLLKKNGTYTLTVEDRAGNVSKPNVKKVTSFDTTPPEIQWIGYESDKNRITFCVSDDSYFYNNQALRLTISGGGLSKPVIESYSVYTNPVESTISDVNISQTDDPVTLQFEDFAGNKAPAFTFSTKENKSKPVVAYTLNPSIEEQPWAKKRDLTFTYYDPDGDLVASQDTRGWLISKTMVEKDGFIKTVEKYELSDYDCLTPYFTDTFGNKTRLDIDARIDLGVDSVNVTIPDSAKTGWHRSVDANVTIKDTRSGPKAYRIDTIMNNNWIRGERIEIPAECIKGDTATFTATIDKKRGEDNKYYFVGIDGVGREGRMSVDASNVNIDDQTPAAPALTATLDGAAYTSGSWAKGDVALQAANDGTEGQITISGHRKMQMQIDDGNWTDYDGSKIIINRNTTGTTYRFRNVNNAGTFGAPAEIVVRRAVISAEEMDKAQYSAADLTINGQPIKDGWYNAADKGENTLAVLVRPKTAIGTTGIKTTTKYKLEAGPALVQGTLGKDNLIPLDYDGLWTLHIWVEDEADNKSTDYEININVDTTAPVVNGVKKTLCHDDTYGAFVALRVDVTDHGSGFDQACCNFTDGDFFWESNLYNAIYNGSLPLKVRDKAGNVTDYGAIQINELPRKDVSVTPAAEQTRAYGTAFDAAEWFSVADPEQDSTWTYTWADAKGSALSETPCNAGTYTVTGTYQSANYEGSASVKLTIEPIDPTADMFVAADKVHTYNGAEHKPTITVKDTIIGMGKIIVNTKATDVSSTAIEISVDKGTNYNAKTITLEDKLTINAKPIDGATVKLGETLKYNGQTQTQNVDSVTIDGLNASCSVKDNTGKEADTYTMTITGNGNFTGEITKDFIIAQHDALNLNTEVKLVRETPGYEKTLTLSGVPGYPADASTGPKLALGTKTLEANTTATLTGGVLKLVADNANANTDGSVVIKLTGMKNYADSQITVAVKYTDKTQVTVSGITITGAGKAYDGKAVAYAGTPRAAVGNQVVTPVDYTYTWQDADGTKLASAPAAAGSYMLVAAVKNTDTQYTGSVTIPFTIEKKNVTAPVQAAAVTYNGEAQTYALASTEEYTVIAAAQTNANEIGYDVTIALNDKDNTQWADGKTADLVQKFIINKAVVTVTADNKIAHIGSEQPTNTYRVTGLMGEDKLNGTVTFTDNAANMDKAGSCTITPAGGNAGENYTIQYKAGTLTVEDHSWNTELSKNETNHWYECSVCGARKDEAEHSWQAPVFEFAADGKTAEVKVSCSCGQPYGEVLTAQMTSQVKTPATEGTMGITTYTATLIFEGETYTATKDVQDIPKVKPVQTDEETENQDTTGARGNSLADEPETTPGKARITAAPAARPEDTLQNADSQATDTEDALHNAYSQAADTEDALHNADSQAADPNLNPISEEKVPLANLGTNSMNIYIAVLFAGGLLMLVLLAAFLVKKKNSKEE